MERDTVTHERWASGIGEGAPEVQRLVISRLFDEWIERF